MDDVLEIIEFLWDTIKNKDKGCIGCAFEDKEEWELPCVKCKRNCKDYWRRCNEDNNS